MGEMH